MENSAPAPCRLSYFKRYNRYCCQYNRYNPEPDGNL